MIYSIEQVKYKIIRIQEDSLRSVASADVKLFFRIDYRNADHLSNFLVHSIIDLREGERWRVTKQRAVAGAWNWLENYFAGEDLFTSQINIFAEDQEPAKDYDNSLSEEAESELLHELAEIEAEFANATTGT